MQKVLSHPYAVICRAVTRTLQRRLSRCTCRRRQAGESTLRHMFSKDGLGLMLRTHRLAWPQKGRVMLTGGLESHQDFHPQPGLLRRQCRDNGWFLPLSAQVVRISREKIYPMAGLSPVKKPEVVCASDRSMGRASDKSSRKYRPSCSWEMQPITNFVSPTQPSSAFSSVNCTACSFQQEH